MKVVEASAMESCRRPPSAADRSPIAGNDLLTSPASSSAAAAAAAAASGVKPATKISPVSVQETYAEFDEDVTDEEKREYERLLADPSPEKLMISFVDRLERAHQYLEFFDFLRNECALIKADSEWTDVFLYLIKKPERKTRFNKLDEETIMRSIYERVSELQANQILGTQFLGHPDFPPIPEERRLQMYHQFKEWRQVDHIPFSDPTLELISQARRGYLLHQNPQVELDKIKESDPLSYEGKIIADIVCRKVQYSQTTVTVLNLSNELTDERLIELLSVCGEVEKIERTSSFVWAEIAHVTFKDTEAAKIAPLAMDPRLISVHRVFESLVHKFPAENDDDVSNMHERAVAKYKDLRLYYMQRQNNLVHLSQQKDPIT